MRQTELSMEDPVQFLKGVGPARAADFTKLGIATVRDLIATFPRRLCDRREITSVAAAKDGTTVTIKAKAVQSKSRRIRGGKLLITVTFADDTGFFDCVWFNAPWILEKYDGEAEYYLYGKMDFRGEHKQMVHPQMEPVAGDAELSTGTMVPVYPCAGSLTQAAWLKVMRMAVDLYSPLLPEFYPPKFLEDRQLKSRAEAVRAMHFPDSPLDEQLARARLIYDECLLLQLGLAFRRRKWESAGASRALRIDGEIDRRIRALFPFPLTAAQDRAIAEVCRDLRSAVPMHRLVQGDVGSGKTAVAFYAALATVANSCQAVIMAPTELLARQHESALRSFLSRSPRARVRVGLLVGGVKGNDRSVLLASLAAGAVDILIATHAALQEEVVFHNLALAIIDEQHKFGVEQRAILQRKGTATHTLVMTATPIPRSLALTIYGDLDISTIDAAPPGRKPVKTYVPSPADSDKVFDFIRRQLTAGRQAYIVCPLVEGDEDAAIKGAVGTYKAFSEGILRGYRLGLIHGRQNREEQLENMDAFRSGKLDALISTVVIEVGVDVPNATVMIILHAERFGLAQLHQLRGRVARGSEQGYCVLLSDSENPEARARLEALAKHSDGFRIAEEDLRLRGEGEFIGTSQHGQFLKLANLIDDYDVLKMARDDAARLLRSDPNLEQPTHQAIREEMFREFGERLELGGAG